MNQLNEYPINEYPVIEYPVNDSVKWPSEMTQLNDSV